MAKSPSHKFGQIIGNLVESLLEPLLEEFAAEKRLYLDHREKPREARKGRKVTWNDSYGNLHDLDYVLERGGSDTRIGTPVAFIEVAWRRYTKHSRNKAQEIQGAILPIAEMFRWSNPFLGAILSGFFTEAALDQLRSMGFQVLHFPYETIIAAFAREGLDIRFDESTPDDLFRNCVKDIETAPAGMLERVKHHLLESQQSRITAFMNSLHDRFDRAVERVVIIALYEDKNTFPSIQEAFDFLERHQNDMGSTILHGYEVEVVFSNGSRSGGSFKNKKEARNFLNLITTH